MAEGVNLIAGVISCLHHPTNQPAALNPVHVLDEYGEGGGTAIERPADLQWPGKDTEALASLRAEHAKTLEELEAAKEQLKQYRDQMAATEKTIRCDYNRSLKYVSCCYLFSSQDHAHSHESICKRACAATALFASTWQGRTCSYAPVAAIPAIRRGVPASL